MTYRDLSALDFEPVRVGKHGIALRVHYPLWQVALAVAFALIVALIPLTIVGSNHLALDSRAYADSVRSLFPALSDATSQAEGPATPATTANYTAHVGAKMQNAHMCGGCEIVSLSIVLESMGIDPDLDSIVDDFLLLNGHFATGYSGSPYTQGAGYPLGIAAAANGYLESIGSDARAHDLTGASFDELKALVEQGYPVLVWSTISLADPQFTGMYDGDAEWYDNEHCVVLYGFHGNEALVSDPLDGLVKRDASRFADVYDQCGAMAVVVF